MNEICVAIYCNLDFVMFSLRYFRATMMSYQLHQEEDFQALYLDVSHPLNADTPGDKDKLQCIKLS